MKHLVLHIGMAKTGTSSIQDSLGAAADTLRRHGLIYPSWRPFNHSYTFTTLFLQQPRKSYYYKQLAPISEADWQGELARLRQQWLALFQCADRGTWLISAENLGRMSAPEIRALQDFVAPWFDQVRIVAYVRHPLRAIKSQWEQDVKELGESMSAEEILAGTKRRMGYRFLERWVSAFGRENFTLRPFAPERFHAGSLLDDFFLAAGIGLPPAMEVPEVASNPSMGADGAALLLALNRRYPQYVDGRANSRRGLARRLNLLYRAIRRASLELLQLEVRFSAEEAAQMNRRIRYLNGLLAPEHAFDEVVASDQRTALPGAENLSEEFVVELVNELALLADQLANGGPSQSR